MWRYTLIVAVAIVIAVVVHECELPHIRIAFYTQHAHIYTYIYN